MSVCILVIDWVEGGYEVVDVVEVVWVFCEVGVDVVDVLIG